jgi:hypothetical protein
MAPNLRTRLARAEQLAPLRPLPPEVMREWPRLPVSLRRVFAGRASSEDIQQFLAALPADLRARVVAEVMRLARADPQHATRPKQWAGHADP